MAIFWKGFAVGVDEDLQQHVPLAFCFLNVGVVKLW